MADKFEITFVKLEDKHFAAVQWLIKSVFRKSFSVEFLTKKYHDNFGDGKVATVAFEGDQIVGFYGAIIQEFIVGNETIRVAHACDSYTLNSHQGQGIHFRLAQLSYEFMKQQGVKFVYAFHSENTFESTKKLGWKELAPMNRFHTNIQTIPLAKIYKKLGFKDAYQKKVKRALADIEIDRFSYGVNRPHQLMNKSFFEYKNHLFPHYLIRFDNCIFYIKIDSVMQVGFFECPNLNEFTLALHNLSMRARKLGVNEILFQCSQNSEMCALLSEHMNPLPSWRVGYLLFEDVDIAAFEFTFANLDTY